MRSCSICLRGSDFTTTLNCLIFLFPHYIPFASFLHLKHLNACPVLFFLQLSSFSSHHSSLFSESRSQAARSQIHRHPYRLIVMLYSFFPTLFSTVSSILFRKKVVQIKEETKNGKSRLGVTHRRQERILHGLTEPETMFRKRMQSNMSPAACRRFERL